ncbi:TRAP transporter substrate-binding protein [Roseinatronobacter sp. S2]|uniref:TRAP transporter substrate-binding protein n=1 Tax=Roseinatronobacter sp. S2 TaxID=3035471 RepID=UPI00240F25D9|nr:TRAP transporter substrate-binding protein [Roseinatronobacter sp. S2]WFE76181.1 TRAP transporter substrate-binding protein [Roseinatronobacter sp. S2]
MKLKLASTLMLSSALAMPASAEMLSVVGSWSNLPLHQQFEAPFWNETLPAASDGALEVALTTHNEMGLGVGDVFNLLGDGVYDVAMTVGDYAVADAPELEGLDVPLVALDADTALAMVDAARPMVDDIFRERFNSHVLAIAPYPPQIVFCNAEVSGLDDMRGLKVRGSGRMTAKLLEALGAEGVNVDFGEVPGALQRGAIDCAVTGAGSGYNAGWWEVSTHLVTLPLGGWDPVVTAINLDLWNSLDADMQDLIAATIATEFEAPAWASAQDALVNDVACLTGNGDCPYGDARDMVLVEASEADFDAARTILIAEVLPDWAARAGNDWAQRWNDSVGAVVGVTVPLD